MSKQTPAAYRELRRFLSPLMFLLRIFIFLRDPLAAQKHYA
jgi:hypothetical protein